MSPPIATLLTLSGIIVLMRWDRDESSSHTYARWLAALWIGIGCSRPVSTWLQTGEVQTVDTVMSGSPTDRLVYLILLFLSGLVLVRRWDRARPLFSANSLVLAMLVYCGFSLLWSEYPLVGFKRLIKLTGDLTVIMIVLTDANPRRAVEHLLSRLGYILVPVSILMIKYYPTLGVKWNQWTGEAHFAGLGNNKNELGAICLLFGLGALWRITANRSGEESPNRYAIVANAVILSMAVWLLFFIDSQTALVSFMLGSLVMIATRLRAFRGSGMAMTALMASLLSGVVFVVFGAGTGYLTLLGRNATLTERTFLWSDLLSLTSNKLVGSGFENFWAGWRLERIWGVHLWHPNQAHNGYLEVYLNLGWVGILLTVLIILFAWRAVVGNVRRGSEVDRLWLTLFLVALVYNVTEAALFRMQAPVSIFLLMAVIGGMHGWRVVNERATATNLPDRAAPRFSRPVATAWRQKPGGLGAATLRGERAE